MTANRSGLKPVDEKGNTALHKAVASDDLKILEMLLKARPYPLQGK